METEFHRRKQLLKAILDYKKKTDIIFYILRSENYFVCFITLDDWSKIKPYVSVCAVFN